MAKKKLTFTTVKPEPVTPEQEATNLLNNILYLLVRFYTKFEEAKEEYAKIVKELTQYPNRLSNSLKPLCYATVEQYLLGGLLESIRTASPEHTHLIEIYKTQKTEITIDTLKMVKDLQKPVETYYTILSERLINDSFGHFLSICGIADYDRAVTSSFVSDFTGLKFLKDSIENFLKHPLIAKCFPLS